MNEFYKKCNEFNQILTRSIRNVTSSIRNEREMNAFHKKSVRRGILVHGLFLNTLYHSCSFVFIRVHSCSFNKTSTFFRYSFTLRWHLWAPAQIFINWLTFLLWVTISNRSEKIYILNCPSIVM